LTATLISAGLSGDLKIKASNNLLFNTGDDTENNTRFYIDSTGNIGVGTTEPKGKLSLSGGYGAKNGLLFNNLLSTSIYSPANGDMAVSALGDIEMISGNSFRVKIDDSIRLYITNEGNIGIGTKNPTAKLDIDSDTLRLRTDKTPPSTGAKCNKGDISWDSNYIYVCTEKDTWKKASLKPL
jgi:hypothetical protein